MFCGLGVVYLPCGPPLLFFIWGVGDIGYTSITIKKNMVYCTGANGCWSEGRGIEKIFRP